MRHRRKLNHLSRKSAHRKAMMANMASSLILHKRINTTVAKAKALRIYVEPLITKSKLSVTTKSSKEEASHLRRVVFGYLQNKEAVTELFREISAKVIDREGGYTRIIKTGTRLGDNAEMCMMELVDYNENLLSDKAAADSKSKRRSRGAKKKADEGSAATPAAAAPAVAEEVAEAAPEEAVAEVETAEAAVEEKVEEVAEDKAEAPVEEVEAKKEEAPVAEDEVKTETPEATAEESGADTDKGESDEENKKDK